MSVVLKANVDKYKKRYPGAKKPYIKLRVILDRYLLEQQEVSNRKRLEQEQSRIPTHLATPVKRDCPFWRKGNCRNGAKCRDAHLPKSKGIEGVKGPSILPKAAPALPPQDPATLAPKGGGKDKKGKGKGKDALRPTSKPRGVCVFFQVGQCRSTSCPYMHTKVYDPAEAEKLKQLRERSRTPSPPGQKTCWHWADK